MYSIHSVSNIYFCAEKLLSITYVLGYSEMMYLRGANALVMLVEQVLLFLLPRGHELLSLLKVSPHKSQCANSRKD